MASATDLLRLALNLDIGKHGRPEQMRIASIMKRMGWRKERALRKAVRSWVWIRPEPPPPATATEAQP